MNQRRHRKLVSVQSFPLDTQKVCRARKVSLEADTVVSFIKSREQMPCSANFEKKFYLKRNSEVVEQRMCYNTKLNISSRKDLLKVLRLVAEKPIESLEKSIKRGCINEAECTEFVKSNFVNTIRIANLSGNTDNQTNAFVLRNVSYDAFCNKYTRKDQDTVEQSTKVTALKNILKGGQEEKKIGDIYFEYLCDGVENVSFYVIMQLFEKTCSLKSNIKQKLKKVMEQCSEEIKKFNLPVTIPIRSGEFHHHSSMKELLTLDMSNWKILNYKFKSSKDEAFYKQIRRKNRALSEV